MTKDKEYFAVLKVDDAPSQAGVARQVEEGFYAITSISSRDDIAALCSAAKVVLNLVEGHVGQVYTSNLRLAIERCRKAIQ